MTLHRDWISIVLYAVIWIFWILALVRKPDSGLPLILIPILAANPYFDKSVYGTDIRTTSEVDGRHLHSAFRTRDGKLALSRPNRNGRRLALAVMATFTGLYVFGALKNINLQQHPAILVGGIVAIGVLFFAGFLLACIRGMTSKQAIPPDDVTR